MLGWATTPMPCRSALRQHWSCALTHARPHASHALHWQEVPYQEADPGELYTISARGVTVVRSGAGAELTDPLRWKREAALFHQLKQRPMFRTFSSWKPFRCPTRLSDPGACPPVAAELS